jgi:hypothetical protein
MTNAETREALIQSVAENLAKYAEQDEPTQEEVVSFSGVSWKERRWVTREELSFTWKEWGSIFARTERAVYIRYLSRRSGGKDSDERKVFIYASFAATQKDFLPEIRPVLRAILHGDWGRWRDDTGLQPAVFVAWCLANAGLDESWRPWLLNFLTQQESRRLLNEASWPDLGDNIGKMLANTAFDELVSYDFVEELCRKTDHDPTTYFRAGGRLAEVNPTEMAACIPQRKWLEPPGERDQWPPDHRLWDRHRKSLLHVAGKILAPCIVPDLGFLCAVFAHGHPLEEVSRFHEILQTEMKIGDMKTAVLDRIVHHARLWATLMLIHKLQANRWDKRTEIIGVEAMLLRLAMDSPSAWAEALPYMLRQAPATLFNHIDDVTLSLSPHQSVRDSVRNAVKSPITRVRDHARGLLAQMEGLSVPADEAAGSLLSTLARHVDRRPAFPHPLALRSSTWMASIEVEQVLRSRIDEAALRFSSEARARLGEDEEQLTRDLLKEVQFAFRDTKLRIEALGTAAGRAPIALDASYRQLSKDEEEPYGFDLAVLVHGHVPGAFELESAEPIQVKKALRSSGQRAFRESWAIDIRQLRTLLAVSQTSAYWLIDPDGVIHAVPARGLEALIRSAGKTKQASRTVHYHEIRSMSIPLSQFLTDLVIGAWVGTSAEKALDIVKGNVRDRRPRQLFEVTLHWGKNENQGQPPRMM